MAETYYWWSGWTLYGGGWISVGDLGDDQDPSGYIQIRGWYAGWDATDTGDDVEYPWPAWAVETWPLPGSPYPIWEFDLAWDWQFGHQGNYNTNGPDWVYDWATYSAYDTSGGPLDGEQTVYNIYQWYTWGDDGDWIYTAYQTSNYFWGSWDSDDINPDLDMYGVANANGSAWYYTAEGYWSNYSWTWNWDTGLTSNFTEGWSSTTSPNPSWGWA